MTEVEKIAKGLTEAQRRFVMELGNAYEGYKPAQKCEQLGLGHFKQQRFGGYRFVWGELGLAVRQYLQEQSQ